jgi:hypothetical protein
MEYIEFRKSLKKWRVTVKDFARIVGFSENTNISSSWRNRGMPMWVSILVETIERLSLEEREKFFAEKLGEK